MEEDLMVTHLPPHLQEKIKKGGKLKKKEKDKFENEYGKYRSRIETTAIDLINVINKGFNTVYNFYYNLHILFL